jgi:hypothetical protein
VRRYACAQTLTCSLGCMISQGQWQVSSAPDSVLGSRATAHKVYEMCKQQRHCVQQRSAAVDKQLKVAEVVGVANAVVCPRAVMVHAQNAAPAHAAVVRTRRLCSITLFAVARRTVLCVQGAARSSVAPGAGAQVNASPGLAAQGDINYGQMLHRCSHLALHLQDCPWLLAVRLPPRRHAARVQ